MDVFVVETEQSRWTKGKIFGLGDAVDDATILHRSLREWRGDAKPAPMSVSGPCLVVGADTHFSPGFLKEAMKIAAQSSVVTRIVANKADALSLVDPLSRLSIDDEGRRCIDAWVVPLGATFAPHDDAARRQAKGTRIETRQRTFRFPADPEVRGDDEITFHFSGALIGPVGHWVELLRMNLLALGGQPLEQSRLNNLARYFGAVLTSGAFAGPRLAKRLNRFGTGVEIHPTAVVEGCRLGDFVEIGPGAIVRGSTVAKDVRIDAQAIVELSVVGGGARVQRRAMITASTVMTGARVGGVHQFSLIGRRAATKMFATGTDMRLGGAVKVETPTGLKEVDIGYQGPLIGHEAFVASGVWIAPGRTIANGARVGRDRTMIHFGDTLMDRNDDDNAGADAP